MKDTQIILNIIKNNQTLHKLNTKIQNCKYLIMFNFILKGKQKKRQM